MVGGSGYLPNETLLAKICTTHPLSLLMAENVAALRDWARDRTVPANENWFYLFL